MKNFLLSTICFASVFSFAQIPTNGLIGYWPFNSNANDESTFQNNGIVNGAVLTTDRFGNSNKAYLFDGISNYVECLPLNNFAQLTLSTWVLSPVNFGGQIVVQNNKSNCTGVNFEQNFGNSTSNLITNSHNSTNCNSAGTNLNTVAGVINSNYHDVWHNLISTIDANGSSKLFIDGVLFASNNNNVGFFNCPTANSSLRFGGLWWNNDAFCFKGKIDDIAIWNRVLTQQEITNLQTATTLDENEYFNENQINIYPNPIQDFFTIDFQKSGNAVDKNISISNYLGQEVFRIFTKENSIEIKEIKTSGIYLIKIYDFENNLLTTKRIIKN